MSKLLRRIIPALMLTSIEAFVALVCILSGSAVLIRPERLAPSAAEVLFPGWTIYVWGVGLTIGGVLSILGIALSDYRLERIGVLALMTTVGAFSFALVGDLPQSFTVLLTFVLFSLAMAARYWYLGSLISIQRRSLKLISGRPKDGPEV